MNLRILLEGCSMKTKNDYFIICEIDQEIFSKKEISLQRTETKINSANLDFKKKLFNFEIDLKKRITLKFAIYKKEKITKLKNYTEINDELKGSSVFVFHQNFISKLRIKKHIKKSLDFINEDNNIIGKIYFGILLMPNNITEYLKEQKLIVNNYTYDENINEEEKIKEVF